MSPPRSKASHASARWRSGGRRGPCREWLGGQVSRQRPDAGPRMSKRCLRWDGWPPALYFPSGPTPPTSASLATFGAEAVEAGGRPESSAGGHPSCRRQGSAVSAPVADAWEPLGRRAIRTGPRLRRCSATEQTEIDSGCEPSGPPMQADAPLSSLNCLGACTLPFHDSRETSTWLRKSSATGSSAPA